MTTGAEYLAAARGPLVLKRDEPMTFTPPGISVRCFFEGVKDPPEPFDLLFARVPCEDESVMYRESRWFVTRVTWTQEGPYLDLSYGDL